MDKKRKNSNNKKTNVKKQYNSVSSKVEKKKKNSKTVKSRTLIIGMFIILGIFLLLIFRLAFIQFIQGGELKDAANRQQTAVDIISAKRGNIYDSTGKLLAASAQVDTVSINPSRIKKENKEKVAKAFSDIFELDYESVLSQVNSEKSLETIIKKVEKDKIDELKNWMEYNKIYTGINIDEDTKRYYPYGNLASNLIGFCDTDNNGQEGIELKWNSVLSGVSGKITTISDAVSELIPDQNEAYVAAQNGSNITLTIDANIQGIAEKYLKQACLENECKNGGNAIIMNPSTGDILAMATYPDYDLNSPRTPNDALIASGWDEMSSTDQLNSLYKMWRNKAVSDTYEPGSTFKIITASVGLEENLVDTDTSCDFYCGGYELVNNIRINCWKYETTHGYQTLREALMNSCNPALMQLGSRIGAETLYRYYKAFGFFDKTEIATSGESNSVFWDLENVGNVELATMSFGQRFRITPIQLITAISSVANDGILVKPRIVKEIENPDTKSIVSVNPTNVRQVLSKDTADKVMNMLESVVSDGTGRYGQVEGYSVAGKTGTSEPDSSSSNPMYVASFIGISPVENPEVVVLVALYGPQGAAGHQGGSIAAPVVSQILSEVLPYIGVPSDDLTSEDSTITINTTTLPDVRNKTLAEARKTIEDLGFTCNIIGDETDIVTDQVPKPGTSLIDDSIVNLYSSSNDARVSQEVPNLKGMTYYQAKNALRNCNLNIHVSGKGTVLSQDPMAGSLVEEGTVVNITLHTEVQDTH